MEYACLLAWNQLKHTSSGPCTKWCNFPRPINDCSRASRFKRGVGEQPDVSELSMPFMTSLQETSRRLIQASVFRRLLLWVLCNNIELNRVEDKGERRNVSNELPIGLKRKKKAEDPVCCSSRPRSGSFASVNTTDVSRRSQDWRRFTGFTASTTKLNSTATSKPTTTNSSAIDHQSKWLTRTKKPFSSSTERRKLRWRCASASREQEQQQKQIDRQPDKASPNEATSSSQTSKPPQEQVHPKSPSIV